MNELINGPAGNNPALLAILSEIGGSLQEKGQLQGAQKIQYGVSVEEAKEQISEIRNNKNHPYHNSKSPDYRQAQEKMSKLYSIAFPDQ